MVFLPGFSTKESDEISGGVGMDAVRRKSKTWWTISISSKIDEGTEFIIHLPMII